MIFLKYPFYRKDWLGKTYKYLCDSRVHVLYLLFPRNQTRFAVTYRSLVNIGKFISVYVKTSKV